MRALTTTLAVVIGVAFVAGTYILTDTIFAAFDEIFSESLKGTSVVDHRQGPGRAGKRRNADVQRRAAAEGAERTPGVKLAAGAIFTPGGFFDAEGEQIGSKFAPKFISSTLPGQLEALTYVDGPPAARRRPKPRSTRRPPKKPGLELGDSDQAGSARAAPAAIAWSASPSSATPPSAAPASPR